MCHTRRRQLSYLNIMAKILMFKSYFSPPLYCLMIVCSCQLTGNIMFVFFCLQNWSDRVDGKYLHTERLPG